MTNFTSSTNFAVDISQNGVDKRENWDRYLKPKGSFKNKSRLNFALSAKNVIIEWVLTFNVILGGKDMPSETLNQFLNENLNELKDQGLYNEINVVEGSNGPRITIDGKELINLSSNNYLGLATDDRLKEVAKDAVESHGVGAGAVRTINGTLDLHVKLEEKIAELKGLKLQLLISQV